MGTNPHSVKLDFSAFTSTKRKAGMAAGATGGEAREDPFLAKKRVSAFSRAPPGGLAAAAAPSSHGTAAGRGPTAGSMDTLCRTQAWVQGVQQSASSSSSTVAAPLAGARAAPSTGAIIDLTVEEEEDMLFQPRPPARPALQSGSIAASVVAPDRPATGPSRAMVTTMPSLASARPAPTMGGRLATSTSGSSAMPLSRPWERSTNRARTVAPPPLLPSTSRSDLALRQAAQDIKRRIHTTAFRNPLAEGDGRGMGVEQTPYEPAVQLTREQQEVVDLVVGRKQSVFFTGSAGTGKSLLLRELIKRLRSWHRKDEVAITASTGIAACNIQGTTIHSFAGVGIGKGELPKLLTMIRKNQRAVQRWLHTKVLIIDEVSMLEPDLFDSLEAIAREMRGSRARFGGIQLVICGDFLQLPPVSNGVTRFCFEAKTWSPCLHRTIVLHTVFRQKDSAFVDILNEMRIGQISERTAVILSNLTRDPGYEDGIAPTQLFPVRSQVDAANRASLNQLPGELRTFRSIDEGEQWDLKKLKDNCIAMEVLELKIGAQVMLIKNMEEGLVNGSLGKVVGFGESGLPIIDFAGDLREVDQETWTLDVPQKGTVASRKQIPLLLSYAMSIHKSQGQTLERVKVDLSRIFEKGQAYVALSRATSLEGLQVLNFNVEKVKPHPKVIEFNKQLSRL